MPLIETVVLVLPLRDLSCVQQSGTTMEEPVPRGLILWAERTDVFRYSETGGCLRSWCGAKEQAFQSQCVGPRAPQFIENYAIHEGARFMFLGSGRIPFLLYVEVCV